MCVCVCVCLPACLQVSVPVAHVEGGPVGLGLIGPPGSDEQLLQVAVKLAAALQLS
jgi:amidase